MISPIMSSSSKIVTVAAVQAAPVSFDLARSLEKLGKLTAEAAAKGADLVVFPWVNSPTSSTVLAIDLWGREWYARYCKSSVEVPSPEYDVLVETARNCNVLLQVGIIEKAGGTLYCTALLLDRDGSMLYKHRKASSMPLIPTAAERLVWGRGAGDGLAVEATSIGKIGSLICWENYMPAARMALYQQGIEIYLAPNADDLPAWTATMQHIAKEGRCFVISVNSVCRVSDFPDDYPPFTPEHHDRRPDGGKWEKNDIVNHGGSCVVGPLGHFLSEPLWDKEAIIYAKLDLGEIHESRLDFDPVGSYSRPDIFGQEEIRHASGQGGVSVMCQNQCRECVYKPSRRGGSRARRKDRPLPDDVAERARQVRMAEEKQERERHDPISVANYIDPGAGLAQIQEDFYQDSDLIFDSLFASETTSVRNNTAGQDDVPDMDAGNRPETGLETLPQVPMVRTYSSDAAILEAYYVFIHAYFPILPPPVDVPVDRPLAQYQNQMRDDEFEPSSPISLAISAILALIPCPDDMNHQDHESVLFRRKYAQYLAQSAIESIEIENEIPHSSVEPAQALEQATEETANVHLGISSATRMPFHPGVPLNLESVIALDILSVYEYAQRGNIKKMQSRAGQALVAAMALGLHTTPDGAEAVEAKRRVWWMTYVCVCQGSIVGNTNPTFEVFAQRFTTKFPIIEADPEAQQAILAATQFVVELNKTVQAGDDMTRIYARMKEFELFLEPLNTSANLWDLPGTIASPVDPTEQVLTRSLRCMARIKLNSARIKVHRYCAFYDHPVFSRRHCDLTSVPSEWTTGAGARVDGIQQEPKQSDSCSCSSSFSFNSISISPPPPFSALRAGTSGMSSMPVLTPSDTSRSSFSSSNIPTTSPSARTNHNYPSRSFPFSSHQSAKICLKSALNITQSFAGLPYPNPTGIQPPPPTTRTQQQENSPTGSANPASIPSQVQQLCCLSSPTCSATAVVAPRTMPAFACCAMQCAYALLMVVHKTNALYPAGLEQQQGGETGSGDDNGLLAASLLTRLRQGLASILATLENYGVAFEALGGMRDQIRSAADPFLTPT
ncbi:nitrilase cyanide hydratase and apolipoprotein n-acyltransferase [Grosmannia clavigera kw1407]|uniref:Nitrilase cyanide hydratase and apolipoprotein n-acyltransferase n=1 Tax=Grosmannia clavigera (strain kw1407 / UAMH 11150) TaxID=655863 RepID=F0X9W0_GROCL|nr:nitrilase cyanide hydratase and apolipoprotein n-acyltransferase [Grosmannia clavigera kw1407]EFX05807.1 nitrilase cyanide hydratase and apolipoprotein n-acyltransferase [Grosmannia clavigera kw1407]